MTDVLEIDVDQVTERLRASKARHEDQLEQEGRAAGRRWAADVAEHHELKALIDAAPSLEEVSELAFMIDKAIGADPRNEPEASIWFVAAAGRPLYPDDAHARGFLEGAREVWEEVSDRI